jgi:hypothetical protein
MKMCRLHFNFGIAYSSQNDMTFEGAMSTLTCGYSNVIKLQLANCLYALRN